MFQNILSFGDSIHKVHPLAGQGFNMTLRDTQELLKLFKRNIELGLDLNESLLNDFIKKVKPLKARKMPVTTFGEFETMRRKISNLFSTSKNATDKKNLTAILNEFDKKLDGKIQTNISAIKNYCKAEEYHQKYIEKNR